MCFFFLLRERERKREGKIEREGHKGCLKSSHLTYTISIQKSYLVFSAPHWSSNAGTQ